MTRSLTLPAVCLRDEAYEAAESPLFDERTNKLYFCDIVPGMVYRIDLADGSLKGWKFAAPIGSLSLAESGRLVVAFGHTVALFDTKSGDLRPLCTIEPDSPRTRLNDGKVGPDGAFWVGSIHDPPGAIEPEPDPMARTTPVPLPLQRDPIGSLYRVSPSGEVRWLAGGYRSSNGLAFSPDGTTMYHADTGVGTIDRWQLDPATGEATNRRLFATVTEEIGQPDGAAMDADGFYWSAGITAARLNRFAPNGRLVETYALPVAAPTMPCFGGAGLSTLFVTSLRRRRSRDLLTRYPWTGRVVSAPSPVAGFPIARFHDV